MKRGAWMLIVVLLVAMVVSACADELVPAQKCEHMWKIVYDEVKNAEGENEAHAFSNRLLQVDAGDYHVTVAYLMNRCMKCGVEQEMPLPSNEPHEYFCAQVQFDENNTDIVAVTYNCAVCDHIRRESLSVSEIQATDPASTDVSCLQGGACPTSGYLDSIFWGELVQIEDRYYQAVFVQVEEDGVCVTKLSTRQDCPFCGRPQMLQLPEDKLDLTVYNGVPTMTYEEFMEFGTDAQAPYKLVDRIRNQTPAV